MYAQSASLDVFSGTKLLLDKGGHALNWPVKNLANILLPVVQESAEMHTKQSMDVAPSSQPALLALQAE